MPMHAPRLHICRGQRLWLTAERTIFWEEEKTLILSDTHLGKSGHFRKSGIPVPPHVSKQDLVRLFSQVSHFTPKELLINGDFFHSHYNAELDQFSRWRENFPNLVIRLVRGNHDILDDKWYRNNGISIHEKWESGPFCFVHDLNDRVPETEQFVFSGHLHPGVLLKGAGRQYLRLPCFYFGHNHAILPAYSAFSGTALIEPQPGESVFAIANNSLIQLQ